uniref:Melatonin receptor n=1 Tax=Periplaneta americana TaxID=6978 RepID=A0A0U5AH58_PERAM|nr:melatonin receptor [Periplaneta americana]
MDSETSRKGSTPIYDYELESAVSSNITVGEFSRFSRPLLNFAAAMTLLIMVVGILGNLLTIVALVRCPKVRNVAASFIISLCVADFIFCTCVLPFSFSTFLYGNNWIHGGFLCYLLPFMRYSNIGVSLLSIAMITINRYIMIAHYRFYSRIYKKLCIAAIIAFCWALPIGSLTPTLVGVWGHFGQDTRLNTCNILRDEDGGSPKSALFLALVVLCGIILIFYMLILFCAIHRSEKRLRERAAESQSEGSNSKEQCEAKAKRNECHITMMMLAIFPSFLMCYVPIIIIKIRDNAIDFPELHILGYLLLYLSGCVNPIIYVIMNKQYRQAYKTVLLCQRPQLLSSTPVGTSS